MTYDSVPVIDRSPTLENVFIAAGHNMLGLSMAPATGKLVAELVTGPAAHRPGGIFIYTVPGYFQHRSHR